MPLISDASSIRVGSVEATAVYLGSTLVWPLTSTITSIMVSGAGDSGSNGLYNLGGTFNGKQYWQSQEDSRCFILYDSTANRWGIGFSGTADPETAGFVYETETTSADSPVGLAFTGSNLPNPTVEAAHSVLVSGAGASQVNGVYTYSGVLYNYPYYSNTNDVFYKMQKTTDGKWIIIAELNEWYIQSVSGLTNPWDGSFTPIGFGTSPAPTVTAYQ